MPTETDHLTVTGSAHIGAAIPRSVLSIFRGIVANGPAWAASVTLDDVTDDVDMGPLLDAATAAMQQMRTSLISRNVWMRHQASTSALSWPAAV